MNPHFARALMATKADPKATKDKEVKESQSFTMNLFRGQVQGSQVFPYPDVLTSDQRETLQMLIDPTEKFFQV
jgi:very long chain acyl-CoA dehydrogenase